MREVQVAGWVLLHFVWQGTLVGLATAVGLRMLRSASATLRYLVACAALAVMMAAPTVTARLLSTAARTSEQATAPSFVRANDTVLRAETPTASHAPAPNGLSVHTVRLSLDALIPALVTAWFAGVALLLLRLAGGCWRVRRLHLDALALTSSRWQAVSDRIASRLHLRRCVHVADSLRVDTPTVLGWLRPVVLLPIAALANLAPAQVEAILAHELAHVRRHDYLVNLLQSLAETLLFYHPAVWWVSSRIRAERENCCDDVAVSVCGDAVDYATALTELETWRTTRATFALAATGGSLLARVRRLLRQHSNETRSPAATIVAAVALLILILAAGVPRLSAAIQPANGQAPATNVPPVAFEVASVKPNAAGPTAPESGGIFLPSERVNIVNFPLRTIIQMAYQVNAPQMIGAPGWIANERFDVTAKADMPSSADQLRAMLQTLLADRFKLAAHTETRTSPVYALVVARSDGRLGPGLHPEAQDCEPLRVIARATPGARDPCGAPSNGEIGHLAARSKQIDLLATLMRTFVDRPVVNKTGLTGGYDWDLTWTPRRPPQGSFDHDAFAFVDPDGPSIFTAVQEQLGLKFEPTTGPDPVLVIDHVEHPTAD